MFKKVVMINSKKCKFPFYVDRAIYIRMNEKYCV